MLEAALGMWMYDAVNAGQWGVVAALSLVAAARLVVAARLYERKR